MAKVTLEIPTLYGDHHVIEVRRILLAVPGVESVYASSALHLVEVTYDPAQVNDLQIEMALDEAGYLGEWTLPMETGSAEEVSLPRGAVGSAFRHTEVYEHTRQVVSFAQKVPNTSRPLWPCPGMGVIRTVVKE
jgi:copper chaperone CopZ